MQTYRSSLTVAHDGPAEYFLPSFPQATCRIDFPTPWYVVITCIASCASDPKPLALLLNGNSLGGASPHRCSGYLLMLGFLNGPGTALVLSYGPSLTFT